MRWLKSTLGSFFLGAVVLAASCELAYCVDDKLRVVPIEHKLEEQLGIPIFFRFG